MSKIIFWLAVIFGVLLVLRLVNSKKTAPRSRQGASLKGEEMVRCGRRGVYLPRSEASESAGKFLCRDPRCLSQA